MPFPPIRPLNKLGQLSLGELVRSFAELLRNSFFRVDPEGLEIQQDRSGLRLRNTRPAPVEFWALLTEAGDYLPPSGGSGSGSGPEPPAGCAVAYAWQEAWDDANGCMVVRPGGRFGSLDPSASPGASLPAFDVNGGVTELPAFTWLRRGRNSPFWYFDRALTAASGSGSGSPLRLSDLIRCTADGAQIRDVCLEIVNDRIVATDCQGNIIAGGPATPGGGPNNGGGLTGGLGGG